MKVMERNVMRLVAVQHLRTAYGIKIKNWNKNKAASNKSTTSNTVSLKKNSSLCAALFICVSFAETPKVVLTN